MRSPVVFLKILIVVQLAVVVGPAHAGYTEIGGAPSSTWVTVKTKVVAWWNSWAAPTAVPSQAPAPAPAPVNAVASAGQGASKVNATDGDATTQNPSLPLSATSAGSNLTSAPIVPKYQTPESVQKNIAELKQMREEVKGQRSLVTAEPGRAGSSVLPKSKAGVPVVDWSRVRKNRAIPRLDIGREPRISSSDFKIKSIGFIARGSENITPLASPPVMADKDMQKTLGAAVAKVSPVRSLQGNLRPKTETIIDHAKVASIRYTIQQAKEIQLKPYQPLSEEHLKMVAALLLFEKGNHCHMIMGLFNQLAQAEKTKTEARYHLGACAHSLKMHQLAFDRLSDVVASGDADFNGKALELVTTDMPTIYEENLYRAQAKVLKSVVLKVTEGHRDPVYYRMAKGAYRAGDYKNSLEYSSQVNPKSEFGDEARFLSAMNSFALKDKAAAQKKLQGLVDSLEARKVQNTNLRALANVNLARMNFAQRKYDQALEAYMRVPKDHPLWVQALIEQGWTQLAIEDYAGAIGNMYSLHSPYFKAVYQPESFVVRTIGYLSICQYGDAYKSLSWLERDYREWSNRMTTYLSSNTDPLAFYGTIKSYIRGKSTESIEGVPYQVWRELARQKDFLNLQVALNDKQDEGKRYEGVNEKIKTEKAGIRWRAEQAKKRFDNWRGQIAKIPRDKSLEKNRSEWEAQLKRERDLTVAYRFQLAILEQSRQGYLELQSTSQKKLDAETASLNLEAGRTLISRARSMQSEMQRVLENNELLRYEVFAGSGENIRYQVAGGEVGSPNRVPAHIKPVKMMNWSFDGEFWEDEIGSYRSSLQNACPTSAKRPAERQEGEQAKLNEN